MKHRFFSSLFLIAISSLIFLNLFICAPLASATAIDDVQNGVNQAANNVGLPGDKTPEQLVANIINVILGFLGVIFLLLTIYAGFLWMTASGEEKKVTKAKGILTSSITGLVIILAAYLLVNFVIFTLILPSAS